MKSLYSLMLLDQNEQWKRQEVNLTYLPDIIRTYLAICAGAGDIPVTRMLGDPPKGMNATGDSDIRNYYDRVSVDQNMHIKPALARLDQVLVRSALGTYDDTIFYNWNPLWQMDQMQRADIATKKANAFKIDADSGLIPTEVLTEARINQLIEDGTYPGLEQALDEYTQEQEAVPSGSEPVVDAMAKRIRRSRRQYRHDLRKTRRGTKGAMKAVTNAPKIAGMDKYMVDMKPRALQVTRKVLNATDILSWARKVGIKTLVNLNDLRLEIFCTDKEVDWLCAGEAYVWAENDDHTGKMIVNPGGPRAVEQDADGVVELEFASNQLVSRHCDFVYRFQSEDEAMAEYLDWHPCLVIANSDVRLPLEDVKAYQGMIQLGPEEFNEAPDPVMETLEGAE